jgi:hypothetical protein
MLQENGNGEFKGSTLARLNNIEHSLEQLRQETKQQSEQLESINRKLSYVYGFAGGIGVIAGVITTWLTSKLGM